MSKYSTPIASFWKINQGLRGSSFAKTTAAKKALDVMIDAWSEQTFGPLPEPGSLINLAGLPAANPGGYPSPGFALF